MRYLFLALALFLTKFSFSAVYYVAVNGVASNNGTSIESPFSSIEKAIAVVKAGDVILIRGGEYKHSTTVSISKSGTIADTIYMLAYENEKPVFNFSTTAFGKRGISLSGSYWKIKGIEMMYAGDNALNISGNNNTIECCSFHDNKDTGLQLNSGAHDNKIINCDSYFNADPTDYGDADGFAAKMDVGSNNYFYGCRAWFNVDDGWDGYMRGNTDVNTVLENCWTWSNGYFKDGRDGGASANGNGFKVGGSDDKTLKHNFTLINCLAFYNKAKGFDQNNNKGDMFFYNCTGFGNKKADFSIPSTIASGKVAEVKNCVLYNGTLSLANFVIQVSNSWDSNYTVNSNDFISVDTSGISGARKVDGSLPDIGFMHLAKGSDLIDAGINLGFPFIGSAPDLGAFETVYSNNVQLLKKGASFYAIQDAGENITLFFDQMDEGQAAISVFNLAGNKIIDQKILGLKAGAQKYCLQQKLPTGIYLFMLNVGGKSFTSKVILN